jgi:hypothetical protein
MIYNIEQYGVMEVLLRNEDSSKSFVNLYFTDNIMKTFLEKISIRLNAQYRSKGYTVKTVLKKKRYSVDEYEICVAAIKSKKPSIYICLDEDYTVFNEER